MAAQCTEIRARARAPKCHVQDLKFSVDDAGTIFIILQLGHPHTGERMQGGQQGGAQPRRILPLRKRHGLDRRPLGRQSRDLLLHPLVHAGEQRIAPGQHKVPEHLPADIRVALGDTSMDQAVQARHILHSQHARCEHDLRRLEAVLREHDAGPVRHFVFSLVALLHLALCHFCVIVCTSVAECFLDILDLLPIRVGGKGVALALQLAHEIVCDISPCDGHGPQVVWQAIALPDWGAVGL
mmetsp:Transcript_58841/g.97586  ORF Transcript_58841/g.97586 Transcript_58841/m.97586 type:complete len:240 (-) Transcript_58841:603-1322(-)